MQDQVIDSNVNNKTKIWNKYRLDQKGKREQIWGFKTKFIDSKKNMQDQDFQVSISQSVFALQDWESTIPLSHRKNSSKLWPISQVVEISPDKWNIWTCFSRESHQKFLVLFVTVPVRLFAQANYKVPSSHQSISPSKPASAITQWSMWTVSKMIKPLKQITYPNTIKINRTSNKKGIDSIAN